jgi:DNA-binding SARP family transcriptional activator
MVPTVKVPATVVTTQGCGVGLLGGLRVALPDGSLITRFRTQKTAALLAFLAYHRGRMHSREALIELLWPEVELAVGRNRLKQELASLRRHLEPPPVPPGSIVRAEGRASVGLAADNVTTDVAEFEAAIHAARRAEGEPMPAVILAARWTEATERYGGPLLPGFDEPWIEGERQRLAGLYRGALRSATRWLVRAGNTAEALEYARRAVDEDPFDEDARADRMRVHAARGEPDQVRRELRELTLLLRREGYDEPSERLRDLAEQLTRQAAALVRAEGGDAVVGVAHCDTASTVAEKRRRR